MVIVPKSPNTSLTNHADVSHPLMLWFSRFNYSFQATAFYLYYLFYLIFPHISLGFISFRLHYQKFHSSITSLPQTVKEFILKCINKSFNFLLINGKLYTLTHPNYCLALICILIDILTYVFRSLPTTPDSSRNFSAAPTNSPVTTGLLLTRVFLLTPIINAEKRQFFNQIWIRMSFYLRWSWGWYFSLTHTHPAVTLASLK